MNVRILKSHSEYKFIIGIYMSGCCNLLSEYVDKDINDDIKNSIPNDSVKIICLIDNFFDGVAHVRLLESVKDTII